MAYQDAWKRIGGLGDPARTIIAETNLLDKQNQLIQQGNQSIADLFTGLGQSDANRIAAEAENLFNTGNPLVDNRDRKEYAEGEVGIHSPAQLSKLFGAQLKADQDTVQSEAKMFDDVSAMRHKQQVDKQMSQLDFNDPNALTEAFQIQQQNKQAGVEQGRLNNQILETIDANLIANNYNFNPENITNAMSELGLDTNDPKSYTSAVETAAINKSALRLQKLNDGLSLPLATKLATKLLSRTKYAGEFARGKDVEGKRTIATDKVEALSSGLVNAAILDPDLKTTYKNKVTAVNNALKYIGKTSNMPKEDRERWDTQIMGVLDSMNLIPGSGLQGRFGEARSIFTKLFQPITNEKGEVLRTSEQQALQQLRGNSGASLSVQARFKDHIRKRLKDPKTGFPTLPDRIIDAHIDKLVAADSELGPAFTLGKSLAAERVKLRDLTTQNAAALRLRNNKISQEISIAGGGPETAINHTIAALTEKGIIDQSQASLDGQNKFKMQATEVYKDLRDSFIYDDPETGEMVDLLDDQGIDAFNMAFYKMTTGKTRVQKDTGLLGVQAWFTDDYDFAGAGGEMSARDPQNLLRIMLKSVPRKASDAMKTNIKSFKKAVLKRKQLVADGIETDAMKNHIQKKFWFQKYFNNNK